MTGESTKDTRTFQVASTSKPASFTLDLATAASAFLLEMNRVIMRAGHAITVPWEGEDEGGEKEGRKEVGEKRRRKEGGKKTEDRREGVRQEEGETKVCVSAEKTCFNTLHL